MDTFWNALDNLRAQLVQTERTELLQDVCRRETETLNSVPTGDAEVGEASASGLTTEGRMTEGKETPAGAVADTERKTSEEVIALVEKTLLDVMEALGAGEAPCLTYRRRNTWANIRFQEGKGLEMTEDPSETKLRFDSLPTVKRFALTVKLLGTIHRLLQTNTYCTKRDLYYQDPAAFGSQSCLDAIVDNIGCMLRVPRACLHVLATTKGLVCGDLRYTEPDGTMVDCHDTSTMVPAHVEAIQNMQSDARFVLVVEKDATYQRLVDEQVCTKLAPCIIITAKGFPDVNTRLLVRRIWDELHIPVLALVDADPYGMEILMVYRFGSMSLSYDASSLTVPVVRWLGVWPSDITRFKLAPSALIPLTQTDINKAQELLRRPYIAAVPTWKAEIETLLELGVKAEIQSLDSVSPHFLTDVYLPNKLSYGGWL